MSAGVMAGPPAPAPSQECDADLTGLIPPVRRVLTAAVSSADLISLELRVCGLPQLSVIALSRSSGAAPSSGLVLWPTVIDGCAWHDGLVLVASAVSSDARRRVAVHGAATLVADLLIGERRRLDAEARASHAIELAGVDALTGLGNRRTWLQALDVEGERAKRYARSSTVVVVDLDDLKKINDQYGHTAGDTHLQRAAVAVREASRSIDVVCRLGGDEFGVLAAETGPEGARQLAERLGAQLSSARVRASLGVATAEDGDLERAWDLADQEMYQHKRSRSQASG